jgi:hypothetical protein
MENVFFQSNYCVFFFLFGLFQVRFPSNLLTKNIHTHMKRCQPSTPVTYVLRPCARTPNFQYAPDVTKPRRIPVFSVGTAAETLRRPRPVWVVQCDRIYVSVNACVVVWYKNARHPTASATKRLGVCKLENPAEIMGGSFVSAKPVPANLSSGVTLSKYLS